jgi:hypothetical protein
MNFCFFFNTIGQKVHHRDVFSTCLFYINVHFTTHLIKEIKQFGPMFVHQLYAYERFNGILKFFVRN